MVLNPQARLKVWETVRNANCTLCPLHENARTVCLLGDGPVPSQIMVVGEAPGAREDDVERPFSGVAGQYLDRILDEVGLPRSSLYITNAVRCRPQDNRTPSRSEIKACSSYMVREVQIVRPDYLLLLGNSALQAILNTSGVMSKRGTAQEIKGGPYDGATAFVTMHPAAVLRNPGLESAFRSDLLSFARLVAGQDRRPETTTKIVQSSRGLAKLLLLLADVDTPIVFDVETTTKNIREKGGFEMWAPDGQIMCVGLCWKPGESYVVMLEHPEVQWDIPISRVYKALNVALTGKRMVNHNVKFDAKWFRAKGVKVYCHFDTLVAAHLLNENTPNGLKALSRTYLGADDYAKDMNWDGPPPPLRKLAIYNGKDVDYTLRLYYIFREELQKRPRLGRLFKTLSMPALRAFVEIERNGFPVDMERLEARNKEILRTIRRIERQLLETVPDELKQGEVNFRSPIFLGRWLFGALELPILEIGEKSGRPSTKESVLLRLRHLHPAAALLMELRKWQKYESTYTRNWLARVERAGKPRLYTSYNISGTVTGRLSSDMQQVPRDIFIRSIIGSGPGWKFIEADFSQVELRIAAMFSGDPALVRAYQEGEDVHARTAWTVDRDAAIRAEKLLRLWSGIQSHRPGTQVLSELLKLKVRVSPETSLEVYLRSCSSLRQNTESGSGIRRGPVGREQSDVERGNLPASVSAAQEEILRTMRQYKISASSSQGSQSQEQQSGEFGDTLQILSSVPSRQLSEIFPNWSEHRKKAKAVGFGFLYGMGARKFKTYAKEKYDTEVSDAEAQEYRKAFFEQYSALPRWHERQRRLVRNLTQVSSPTGRIRHLPSINSTDDMAQGEAEREAINSPVQGFASDLTVLSMAILYERLDPTRCRIIGNVHDSIMFEATDDYAEEAADVVKYTMEHLPIKRLFGYKMTVPIEAEVTIGTHWGEHGS